MKQSPLTVEYLDIEAVIMDLKMTPTLLLLAVLSITCNAQTVDYIPLKVRSFIHQGIHLK